MGKVDKLARIVQLVKCRALDCEVMGSNLPAVPEVILGGHSSGSLTIQTGKSELTLRVIMQSESRLHPPWL